MGLSTANVFACSQTKFRSRPTPWATWLRGWKPWQIALLSGFVFIAVLTAVEWPFANFLMSRASENRFFGTLYASYNARFTSFDRMRRFFSPDSGWTLGLGLARAALYASLSAWIGLGFGRWMRGVQR